LALQPALSATANTLPKDKGDGTMSGAKRAPRLADVRVMMHDVNAKVEVGKIALGVADENSQRLQKGRSYR
jgi:hypothetical protein